MAELESIDESLSKTIVQLFEEEFTIPFLCRYRKDLIHNVTPEQLRDIKETIDNVKVIESKSANLLKALEKDKLLTDDISRSVKSLKSLEELEHLSQLYKPASKGSLYERAKKLGLETVGEDLLYGKRDVNLSKLVNSKADGLKTTKEVEEGVKNIISHLIAKNELVMDEVKTLRSRFGVTVTSSQVKEKKKSAEDKSKVKPKTNNVQKFETYFDFTCPAGRIKPHQILAINRGESLKALTVKYEVDNRLEQKLKDFVSKTFVYRGPNEAARKNLIFEAFADSFKKKISPFIVRQTQSELSRKAEKSAVEVFATNLKNLLLTNPVKGRKILGIDPGFTSGCKLAMISETGGLLETNQVFNLNNQDKASIIVTSWLEKHACSLIAIGNATACRETENFISGLIEKRHKNVQYCIVSEQGASIYSCSEVAKKEFPKIDVSFLGAISIARRLLDPLCELVKIEPKHLGVGMYQHDVNEKTLKKTLDEVVSECVSFVGVDLNVASLSLLKHVAGLTEKRAEAILKFRDENDGFKTRDELLKVKSIGQKTFTQCAGFVRINGKPSNALDATNVHPESYATAKAILKDCGLKVEDIGKPKFVEKIKKYREENKLEKIAAKFKENPERVRKIYFIMKNFNLLLGPQIETIVEALSRDLLHDYRSEVKIEPIFKQGIVDMSTLKPNQIVSGVVMNITDFGAFIDLGVGKNGLIHSSAMRNASLKVSDRVECKVLQVDVAKGRIGLEFVNLSN